MKDRFEYYKNISSIFKIVSIITPKRQDYKRAGCSWLKISFQKF